MIYNYASKIHFLVIKIFKNEIFNKNVINIFTRTFVHYKNE